MAWKRRLKHFLMQMNLPLLTKLIYILIILYLGETIQHELKCVTVGFMFITIIRHIKSL